MSQPLEATAVERLHRSVIEEPGRVRAFLNELVSAGTLLRNGMDHRNRARDARIEWVGADRLRLGGRHIDPERQREIYLNFEYDGLPFFFSALPKSDSSESSLEVDIPRAIYRMERRESVRQGTGIRSGSSGRVELVRAAEQRWVGRVLDVSDAGISVAVESGATDDLAGDLEVRFIDGDRVGQRVWGRVRHWAPYGKGELRLGLSVSPVPSHAPVELERRAHILRGGTTQRMWRTVRFAGASAGAFSQRVRLRRRAPQRVDVVEFTNEQGQPIKGIVDSCGDPHGALAVVIPPAWGRTKETLLPLAATLIHSFERAGQPLTVLRLDGTQQRGESYIDPECRRPGDEALHFSYSQVVRDLHASFRFLRDAPRFRASSIVLVTASLASVSGRRAVATDPTGLVAGWVSLVGMVDLQSGLRTVSGGVDYIYGAARGVRFGVHELGGVKVDIDRAAADVLDNQMGAFEDARRDLAAIQVPVSWIHGRHDGWMDFERVSGLVAAGTARNRRLLEVPTGHQLRNSREALEVFQLVTEEVSRIALGSPLPAAPPDLGKLAARQKTERRRAPRHTVNLREFWHDYMVGRDESVGIELLTATNAYRRFMDDQIDSLELRPGQRVLDVGSGTGDFAVRLAGRPDRPGDLSITCVDLVPAALQRGRRRLPARDGLTVNHVVADLQPTGACRVPLRPSSYDAVLASLLVCYLKDAEGFLRAVRGLLRSGGRLVLSVPRRDADLSSLYMNTLIKELTPRRVRQRFGAAVANDFDAIQRRYLNQAARLVSLEESGQFQFRDAAELRKLVREAGFFDAHTHPALGEPPQVVVLTARRP